MPKSKSVFETYRKLIIKPEEIIELAKLCYQPWKREFEIALRKWKNERLPEIEKQIDKHNKDVKAKKSVFSFNTYLPIGESDKKAIIDKEKNFFIHTLEGVYEFNSSFKIDSERGSVGYAEPISLREGQLQDAVGVKFKTESKGGSKSIRIQIWNDNQNRALEYEISGANDRWVDNAKQDVEEVISKIHKPHGLAQYKFWIIFVPASALAFTAYRVLEKFAVLSFIPEKIPFLNLLFLNLLVSAILFIFLAIKIYIEVDELFPQFAIKREYRPLDSSVYKLWAFIFTTVLILVISEIWRALYL